MMGKVPNMRLAQIAICVLLVLSACGQPPRVTLYEERQGKQATRSVPADRVHIVVLNDSLYGISRRYGVSTRSIISANQLQPPYRLVVGQRLKLPSPRLHRVMRGDTLYGISRQYGVAMSKLASFNDLKPPYKIIVGRSLRLPGSIETNLVQNADMAAQNGLAKASDRRATSRPKKSVAVHPKLPKPPKASGGFVWPVEGSLISRFGTKGKGLHNDGINLAAPRGAPVHAAQAGVVAYAGNELRGFGNLVLIRHDKGLMSAYAHNEALLVKSGDTVRRGQTIARVGSSGSVDRPQLHFEIRRGREAVNPLRFLRQRSAMNRHSG